MRSVRDRRRLPRLAALLAVAVALGAALYLRLQNAPPAPPEITYTGSEEAVLTALRAARERVLKNPRSARAWGELGEVFLANDMEAESSPCFAQAERLDPANPRYPYYQAGQLLNRGERAAALPLLERAVARARARYDENPAPQLMLGETYLALERVDEAEAQFREVLGRDPADARAHFGMALVCSARQDWERCRDHLLRCLDSPHARQKASAQLAFVCQRLGLSGEADRYGRQAATLPRDNEWADPYLAEYMHWAVKKKSRFRHADDLEAAGQLDKAAEILEPMVREFPDDYLVHLTLAKTLGRMAQQVQPHNPGEALVFFRGAEQSLRKARELAPDKVQTHYFLSLVLYAQGEQLARAGGPGRAQAEPLFREAAESARRALAIKPDYGYAHMCLGLSLKCLGQLAEALEALRQAVRCNPEHAELHFHLGGMLAESGQPAEARQQLRQALEILGPNGNATWKQDALDRLAALPPEAKASPGPGKQ
jgi:tetratricopeptide (TPR) repeat protein